MAYGVAVAAGGDLKIDSRVGKRATITLLLPSVDDEADAVAAAAKPAARGAPARVADILRVDDDPEVRAALADMLRSRGHRVTEASNGPHALLELERSSAELMLLDFAMPAMNGAELAAEALALRPDLKLVFVTGYADSEAIDRAVAGRAQVLKKPVSASNLFGVIETLID